MSGCEAVDARGQRAGAVDIVVTGDRISAIAPPGNGSHARAATVINKRTFRRCMVPLKMSAPGHGATYYTPPPRGETWCACPGDVDDGA